MNPEDYLIATAPCGCVVDFCRLDLGSRSLASFFERAQAQGNATRWVSEKEFSDVRVVVCPHAEDALVKVKADFREGRWLGRTEIFEVKK